MPISWVFLRKFQLERRSGFRVRVTTPIMENHMENKMINDMEILGPFKGYIGTYRDIIPQ